MNNNNPLRLAAIGCGGRTQTYLKLAAEQPGHYIAVAAADPDLGRIEAVASISGNPHFRFFRNDEDILAQPKLADVMLIGTQDALHAKHAIAAMEKGYNLLLEKPIASNPKDVERILETAGRLKRRVTVCHVLRYTPFYGRLKQLLQDGLIGQPVTLNASEGVGAFHQAHSFVRGHWSKTQTSSPMILAKSCHDLDIIRWLVGTPCLRVASFGSNTWFHAGNKPEGAPSRCTDGCPVGKDCPYNAMRYLDDQEKWLSYVMTGWKDATREERERWLDKSPWSRCVYQCDNDTVDHQTVNMLFANDVTATFTMTAFDCGRNIQIYGTEGRLYGGDFLHRVTGNWFVFEPNKGPRQTFDIKIPEGGNDGHMGGDSGLVNALYHEMSGPEAAMTSPLDESVDSHFMAFAAEESRLAGRMVSLSEIRGTKCQ